MKATNRFRIALMAMLPLAGLCTMAQDQKTDEKKNEDTKVVKEPKIVEKSIVDEVIWVVGDEAILKAIIDELRTIDKDMRITVVSKREKRTKALHGVNAVARWNMIALRRQLRQAKLFISGGGSLLQNVTSRRSLYYYLAIIFLAVIMRKKVMLYAQGIGPIIGGLAEFAMRVIGNRVDLITVRDQGSLAELARLGITKPKIECTADPVLAIHPVDKEAGRAIFRRYHADGAEPVVGISVRNWQHETRFKDVMAEVADRIVRENQLTAMMITHNMKDAIVHGNRLIMMNEGHIILDIEGEEKKKLTKQDLLEKFAEVAGTQVESDEVLLS